MSNKTAHDYITKHRERREKKSSQQHKRRCGQKRKRSLISFLSTTSISSTAIHESSKSGENSDAQQSNIIENEGFEFDQLPLITNTFNDENFILSNDDEDEMLLNISSSSISMSSASQSSSSSSNSDADSSDNESNDMYTYSHLPDNRPLYPSTNTTVCEFSKDILEFCRISHLPDKQRNHLLDLFRKYLPSPNLAPRSSDDLLGTFSFFSVFSFNMHIQ